MKSLKNIEPFSDAHESAKNLLAANLKRLRKQSGMSQEELGLKIDVDQAYISRLEAGSLNPTLEKLAEVADVLNIEVSKLLSK